MEFTQVLITVTDETSSAVIISQEQEEGADRATITVAPMDLSVEQLDALSDILFS